MQGSGPATASVPPAYEGVPYVLAHLSGEEFVAALDGSNGSTDGLLGRVAAAHPGHTLGLLLEGLHSHLKCVLARLLPAAAAVMLGTCATSSPACMLHM